MAALPNRKQELIASIIAKRIGEILIENNLPQLVDKIYINSYIENQYRPCFGIQLKCYLDDLENLREIKG